MDKAEALRSIQYDLFEYIQKKVTVDFDNIRQSPVSFGFKGRNRVIDEVLCSFRPSEEANMNSFLVRTDDGDVYLLHFHVINGYPWEGIYAGFWVLDIRILNDNELMALYREDRKMLINITLNRVVNFHGHICPDLILGGKFCEYVQKLLDKDSHIKKGLSIIAENSTSALDAIQVLLGTTVGNQRLMILDYGKHNYTVLYDGGQKGIRLSFKNLDYKDKAEYGEMVKKITDNRAGLRDAVRFQTLLDERSKMLLSLLPEDIFDVEHTGSMEHPCEMADLYIPCSECGQQVLRSRIVNHQDRDYCMPCFQRINAGNFYYNLQ